MANMSDKIMVDKLARASKLVKIGQLYCHYKGRDKLYKVLHLGFIEESMEVCVVYQALYGTRSIFVRPLDVWLEKVDLEGQSVERFSLIDN
jgi:hypothetical protein